MPAWGPSPFGPLQLSVEDASKLGQIARTFVQDHMRSYERYLFEDQRRLDERRWKPTKQRGGVQVFVEQPLKERRKVGAATQDELEREYRHHLLRSTDKGELQKRHLRFCGRCVDHARAADTLTIASEELASEDLFAEFYQSLSPQSGETSGRGGGSMGM
ncbi:uncharacterized protein KRP23_197 [Phytophthora ramorum]|uniref:uncharacterized protein n=1 Tax=Phytophthora ramorum TaxID=164328 RepID=UPI0030A901A8|nr:hypothetical protein KRP23_197 [Phytophthora ramorum]